jgi:hypothetical protein
MATSATIFTASLFRSTTSRHATTTTWAFARFGPTRTHRTVSAAAEADTQTIIIYTKETCPLCDGLKDKVQAILDRAPFTGSALQGYRIQARDIMSNPEWASRFSMEIPVLAVVRTDGSEHIVPRQSPRVSADRLERTIIESLTCI